MRESRPSREGLEQAEAQIATLMDIAYEERGEVPEWQRVAHAAVRNELMRKVHREE